MAASLGNGRLLRVACENRRPVTPCSRSSSQLRSSCVLLGRQEWAWLPGKSNHRSRQTNDFQRRMSYSSDYSGAGNGRLPSPRERTMDSRRGERVENFFATCAPGLEEIVAAELAAPMIGASGVKIGSAGVSFCGTKSTGIRANLWLRSAIRVLLELASGPLPRRRRADPVYEFVRNAADWPTLLVDDDVSSFSTGGVSQPVSRKGKVRMFRTFSVNSRVYDCEAVSNSMFASTRAKDAICDAVKDVCGGLRPDPPSDGVASADVPLFFSLYKDRGILYRDMTGVSLHKRGYRDVMHRAGLNEAIAAGLLTIAGWNTNLPSYGHANRNSRVNNSKILMDPMCGSGTFLIEAALMAINSAPGLMRSQWPHETWHDFDPSLLKTCRQEAIDAEISAPKGLRLLGNDIHEGALSLCQRDARAANVLSMLELSCTDCKDYSPPASPSLVVVNPPWGERLEKSSSGDDETLLSTWKILGRFLKGSCSQADVYILSGNSNVTRAMHMKADKRWPVTVGGIDCRIMHYYVLPPKAVNATFTLPTTTYNAV